MYYRGFHCFGYALVLVTMASIVTKSRPRLVVVVDDIGKGSIDEVFEGLFFVSMWILGLYQR